MKGILALNIHLALAERIATEIKKYNPIIQILASSAATYVK